MTDLDPTPSERRQTDRLAVVGIRATGYHGVFDFERRNGQPFVVVEATSHSPTARGANTLVRVRLRNILSGQLVDKTFKSGEKFRQPDLQFRAATYLYADGDSYHFMDGETFEQFSLSAERKVASSGSSRQYPGLPTSFAFGGAASAGTTGAGPTSRPEAVFRTPTASAGPPPKPTAARTPVIARTAP